MDKRQLPSDHSHQQSLLKAEIAKLQLELEQVEEATRSFEAKLRAHLVNELIEEQELTVLYKQQKQAKKAKRLEQKKKGKNYVEPVGLSVRKEKQTDTAQNEADEKEKKRLYREAMLHVHPDKFSMDDSKQDLATEITTRLIEIYKTKDLAALQAYHAHLFSNAEFTEMMPSSAANVQLTASDDYLLKQKEELEQQLGAAKKRHTYHVLTTYAEPMSFVDELKAYYQDRIAKLRKRTRTKGKH